MGEKKRLLDELESSRAAIFKVVSRLDPATEIYPNWTVRHVLAHITGWDEATTLSLRAYLQDADSAIASYRGIDEYNARSVETRQDLNYEQTYKEWEIARRELRDAVQALPEESFLKEILYPWGHRASVSGLVEVIIHHEFEHAEEIEKLKLRPRE